MATLKTFAPKDDEVEWNWQPGYFGSGDEVSPYTRAPKTDTLVMENPEPLSGTEPDPVLKPEAKATDADVIATFRQANPKLQPATLKAWINQCWANGWRPGQDALDYFEPTVTFNPKGEPIIESPYFNGLRGAFATASKILPKNVGAIFWWKQRLKSAPPQPYKLNYSDNTAYRNFLLHQKSQNLDFELMARVANDKPDLDALNKIKAFNDKLLSPYLVQLTRKIQEVIYGHKPEMITGVLDGETLTLAKAFESANTAAQKQKSYQQAEAKKYDNARKGPAHDLLNMAIQRLKAEINADYVPVLLSAADFIQDHALPFQLPHISGEFVYHVAQHVTLGLLEAFAEKPEQELDEHFLHVFTAPFSIEFMAGYDAGLVVGVVEWVRDAFLLIVDIVKYGYKAVKYVFTQMGHDLEVVGRKAGEAFTWIAANQKEVKSFLADLLPGVDFKKIADSAKQMAYGMAENLGKGAAEKLYAFAAKDDFDMGMAVGNVVGYILPDILLSVFSDGVEGLVHGALVGVKDFLMAVKDAIELGKAGRITLKIFETAQAAYIIIKRFINEAKVFTGGAHGKVKEAFTEILEFLEKLLNIERKTLPKAKILPEILNDQKAALKTLGKTADESALKNANEQAEKRFEEGTEKQSEKEAEKETGDATKKEQKEKDKKKVLAEAIALTQIDQAAEEGIDSVMAQLAILAKLNSSAGVRFDKTGSNPYNIKMYGSEFEVDPEFLDESKSAGKESALLQQRIKQWKAGLATREAASGLPEDIAYQIKCCGPTEYHLNGGGVEVWADGIDEEGELLVEAKRIRNPERSPAIAGSQIPDAIRQSILEKIESEFKRYSKVLRDPTVPIKRMKVFVSDERSVSLYEEIMNKFGIQGQVIFEPE